MTNAAVKSSVISHPTEMPMAITRAEYKMITCGDKCAAVLLNAFEHMHNRWGKDWIRRTHAELSEDILWEFEEKAIGRALRNLKAWGFLDIREPTGIIKTKSYRLNIPAVQAAITLAAQLWKPSPERTKVRSNGQKSVPRGFKSAPNGQKSASTYKENDSLESGRKETTAAPPIPPADTGAVRSKAAAAASDSEAHKEFQSNFGLLTPLIADAITSAIDEFTEPWCIDAIKEAKLSGGNSWNYVLKILQRWKREGRTERPGTSVPSSNGQSQIDHALKLKAQIAAQSTPEARAREPLAPALKTVQDWLAARGIAVNDKCVTHSHHGVFVNLAIDDYDAMEALKTEPGAEIKCAGTNGQSVQYQISLEQIRAGV